MMVGSWSVAWGVTLSGNPQFVGKAHALLYYVRDIESAQRFSSTINVQQAMKPRQSNNPSVSTTGS